MGAGRAAVSSTETLHEILSLRLLRAPTSHYDELYASAFGVPPARNKKGFIATMIHYSCDLCKRELDPHHDSIYVVRMEVYPATCGTGHAIDSDRDHLEDVREVLERFEEFDADGVLPENDAYQKRRFDLCGACCQRFLKEPLGRRSAAQFDFSKR
jgi:hypothetical protein